MNLGNYSAIVLSISGGKDSQTILGVIMNKVSKQGFSGPILAIHADTGAEWPQSLPHCEMLCKHYGISFKVANPFRRLPEHIERRCRHLQEQGRKGGWPSSACRYCTSDCKRNPIQKLIRKIFDAKTAANILHVTGERREESSHRAKLPEIESNKDLTAGKRKVTNYRPILDYSLSQIWRHITSTNLPRHIAYDMGNERLSCAICMLASENDIRNGAEACPELAEHYLRIEAETRHTFRHKKSLYEILKGDK